MISFEIKKRLKAWNDTPPESRDYCQGLSLLVQASGNRALIWTIKDPNEKKDFIDYNLDKYIRFAVSDDERQQVAVMDHQVKKIMKESLSLAMAKDNAQHKGKREDHDSLPDEIKALYVENLDLLHRIRDNHLKLRNMEAAYRAGTFKTQCIDAERYPFLVEIISLDKKMHANWHAYDTFVPEADHVPEEAEEVEDEA